MQMLGIHHDQNICFAVCRGAQQVGHTGAQRQRLVFGASLSIHFLYAGPAQFTQRFAANQDLLPHGQVSTFDFLDKTDSSHDKSTSLDHLGKKYSGLLCVR